ncbi:MAG: hypothetical protein KME27_20760 [Lyngbya sp. HA4199-MV5]|jgi:hypothetical protein|nr:hypothetical protein [Lyngbya sp. HA4199-MV5]
MYPTHRQWTLFERYKNCPPPMSPRTFLQQWALDYPDIARLTGVTRDTVSHWFSTGRGSREVPIHHCRRLATIDFFWRNPDRIPQDLLDEWCGLLEDSEPQS